MVAEIKSEVIDCTDGRSCLLEAVHGLPPDAFDLPNVIGDWSVRDCLAHLVGWDAWVANLLERTAVGMPVGPLPTEREINDAAPADWIDRPIGELLTTLRTIRDGMAEQLCRLTDAEREEQSLQVEDTNLSINALIDALIEHEMEHAGQIRSWRRTSGL